MKAWFFFRYVASSLRGAIHEVLAGHLMSNLYACRRSSRVAIGLFIGTVLLICALMYLNASWVARLKAGAMQFVPVDATAFVVVPNLRDFMTYALPSTLKVAAALKGRLAENEDLISLFFPPITDKGPAPCRYIGDLADLERNGIDPDSSASVTSLDYGMRAAIKFSDLQKGLAFLADVLSPIYIELRPDIPSDGPKAPNSDSDSARTFELRIEAQNVELCLGDDRRKVTAGVTQIKVQGPKKGLLVPIRLSGPPNAPTSVRIHCAVSVDGGAPEACTCRLYERRMKLSRGDDETGANCTDEPFDFRGLLRDIEKCRASIEQRETGHVRGLHIAKLSGFYVFEQLPPNADDSRHRVTESLTPVIHDDSFVNQYYKMALNGSSFTTTVFGGARPDTIVNIMPMKGFPLYLMTPMSVHFRQGEVRLESVSNLQPQDMEIVQALAAGRRAVKTGTSWKESPGGLGFTIADPSLKLYSHFTQSFPLQLTSPYNIIWLIAREQLPFLPIIVDLMDEGVNSVSATVIDLNPEKHKWRMAIAVPNVNREYASRLVEVVKREYMERQARWAVAKAAALAESSGYTPSAKGFQAGVLDRLCSTPYWTMKSVRKQKDDYASTVEINGAMIADSAKEWSILSGGLAFHRLAPPNDANFIVWGGENESAGLVAKDNEETESQLKALAKALDEALSDMEEIDNYELLRRAIKSKTLVLIEMARNVENKRLSLMMYELTAILDEIERKSEPIEVWDKLTKLSAMLDARFIGQNGLAQVTEIDAFCKREGKALFASPLAHYDNNAGALYLVEDPSDLGRWPSVRETSGEPAPSHKVHFDVNSATLGSVLEKSGKENEDAAKAVERFPFPFIQLDITGRESGTGVTTIITLRSPEVAH